MRYLLLITILFSGCGVSVNPKPVKVEPIKVQHTIMLDTDKLDYYYRIACQNEYKDIEDEVVKNQLIDTCTNKNVKDFIDAFNYLK